MFGSSIAIAQAICSINEFNEFEKMCDSLPENVAKEFRAARQAERLHEREHREKLEIAREGRSLNFWGNR